MNNSLFAALLLSLFYCCIVLLSLCRVLCGQVYATQFTSTTFSTNSGGSGAQRNNNNIELFKTGETSGVLKPDGSGQTQPNNFKMNDYYSPLIVATDDLLLALSGVNCTNGGNSNDEKNITVLTKYIGIKSGEDNWGKNIVSGDNINDWKTQFAVQNKLVNEDSAIKGILAAVKGNKIYLLFGNCSDKNDDDRKCALNITEGTVSNDSKTNGKTIKWDNEHKINVDESKIKSGGKLSTIRLFGGSAFITGDDNNITFALQLEDKDKKNNYVVISSKDYNDNTPVKMSSVGSADGCTPSFFKWEEKIIMMPTHCTEDGKTNSKPVKELNDVGNTWVDSTGPFARLLGFMQDKSNFTTTKINNDLVLLFTQKKTKTAKGAETKNDAHVWFTDGKRVYSVGRIVTNDNITSASLLHTKNGLFALHQNWDDKGQKNITLTRMDNQLKNITTVITAWKNADNVVENMCKNIFTTSAASSFTEGLVGFLSNNGTNNKSWIDEYYYVNATVTNGDKVSGGIKFKGEGAGAKWPVGKPKEDQPYNFTEPGFTLVANVTIDGVVASDKGNSVLGLSYNKDNQNENAVGLWCTKEGKWGVNGKEGRTEIKTNGKQCQHGNTYVVALMSSNGQCSLYVDGEKISANKKDFTTEKDYESSFYFYFGVDVNGEQSNNVESHVTVTNVLLYNHPFNESEMKMLKIPKKDKPKESSDNYANHTDSQEMTEGDGKTTGGSSGGNDDNSDTTDKDTKSMDVTSQSQPESSTVCGGVSDVLIVSLLLGLHSCYLQ